MKDNRYAGLVTIVAAVLMLTSCASSYQDRLDALTPPEEDGVVHETPAPSEATGISRDEIMHSGACIVSAECPSGNHCTLGRCIAECGVEKPCEDGLFCSARGRCVSDADYIDVDSPIKATASVSWELDEHVIALDSSETGGSFNITVAGGGSLEYRVQVEPSSAAAAVTVSAPEGVVASGGTKQLNVSVNRSSFGEGDHSLSVGVVSDAGQKSVIFEFSNGYSGRYAGFVEYQDPGLGRVPLVLDIKVDEVGNVLGRTVSAGSLLFPEERMITGQLFADQLEIVLSTADVMEAGLERDPFQRDIGREINFIGDVKDMGVIKGEVEELISGLLPQMVSVSGVFYLTRVEKDVPDISAKPAPALPGFAAPATSYSTCAGVTTTCNASNFSGNMILCSDQMRASAFKLGDDFAGVDSTGHDYVNFGLVEECEKDLAGTGTNACADIDVLECMRNNQQHYVRTALAGNAEFVAYFKDLNGFQRLHAFIGNDKLVDAYRTAIHDISSPLTTELARLDDSLASYERAERAFFNANNLYIIGSASQAVVSEGDYELFRVPLEYLGASHSALKRIVSLGLRKSLGTLMGKAALREDVQDSARTVFFEGVALARLVTSHGGTFSFELGQIADELRAISITAGNLEAELNPLGYSHDYVPFIYDPADISNATNFQQLAEMAGAIVTSSVQKADVAEGEAQLLEVKTEEIEQRMLNIEQSYDTQMLQLCGVTELEDLGECGQAGGELALVYNDIEQQYIQIEKAMQQITDLNELVKIKNDSALQISGIKGRTLRFTEASGATLEALEIAEGEIRAAMLRKSGLFGSIGGFFSGMADIAGGVFSGFLEGKFDPVNMSVGGIAGGVSGLVDAGLGAASAATSASMAQAMARVAAQKKHVQNMQQLRFQEEGVELAAVQAAEQVKTLLLQMATLNLELEQQHLRLDQLVIRVLSLLARVDELMDQREVLVAQATRSVSNPLSNLSFRLKRDHSVLLAAEEFEKALSKVYLAARGLEHELNVDLPQIDSQMMQAGSAYQLRDFLNCLNGWYDDYRIAFGSPHDEVTQLSLREDILGFTESVTDEVTGEVIQPQEIFRRVLLDPKYIAQSGRVEFPFATGILGDNKQFSTLVCNDRIKSIKVQLVGDFLGDNEATVMLRQEGDSYLRDCSADPDIGNDIVNAYYLDARTALIQVGVNSFGLASPNYELTGRSVASDRWVLIIPTGSQAPNNADLDFLNIDDVIIEITHTARTLNGSNSTDVFDQCNI
ncbi:MAG: hypothetical protein WC551_08455 [Patescibacteria group bacterium]